MTYHRYPLRSLIRDYARAGAGFLFAAVPLALGAPGEIFFVLLAGLAMLFFGYGLRTLGLQFTAYEIRPDSLVCHGPRRRQHAWNAVSSLRLRYYSTVRDKSRRDLKHGWLELKIVSPAGTTRIDSEVDGFEAILEAMGQAAETHGIAMDETSEENFKAFRAAGAPPSGQTGSGAAG